MLVFTDFSFVIDAIQLDRQPLQIVCTHRQ